MGSLGRFDGDFYRDFTHNKKGAFFIGELAKKVFGPPEMSSRQAFAKSRLRKQGHVWFFYEKNIPSGKLSHNYGKSPFLMGKSTINGNFQ